MDRRKADLMVVMKVGLKVGLVVEKKAG